MMTKISVKQAIIIHLPVEDIFAYMSKLENLPNWSSVIISIQTILATGAGAVGLIGVMGITAKSTVRFLGKWSEMVLQVVECEQNRCLTIKSTSGIAPCLFHYQFELLENGDTSIAQDVTVSLIGNFEDRIEQIVTNAMWRDAKHDLLTLKDLLETGAHTYSSAARA